MCASAKLSYLTSIEVLLQLTLLMVSPFFRMFACSYSGSTVCSENVGFHAQGQIPICLSSVLTQKLWGSDKQGHVTFINKSVHD